MLKKYKRKLLLHLHKLNLMHPQVLKFLRNVIGQHRTDISVNLKIFSTNLQLLLHIKPHWSLIMMMIFPLQEMKQGMLSMHLLTIFYLILQLIHVKIHIEWCWKSFIPLMIQFNLTLRFITLIGIFNKKTNLQNFFSSVYSQLASIKQIDSESYPFYTYCSQNSGISKLQKKTLKIYTF